MISFRYHIVSIVSVFLALAVGVALGGGPLKREVDDTLVQQVEADRKAKADLRNQVTALGAGNEFTDDFARTVATGLLDQTLAGRTVTVVVLPDADQDSVSSTRKLVGSAGGSVGATIRLADKLLDVGNKQLVDELATQLLAGAEGVTGAEDQGTYERLGALLARATATPEDAGAAPDDTGSSILSGLSTAELLTTDGEVNRRGSLVLFLGGGDPADADARESASAVVSAMARSMDAASDGAVLAGTVASARPDGAVEAIRGDVVTAQEVSTVDTLDRVAGQVVAVLALAEQGRGGVGHYGSVDAANGTMPEPATTQ